MCSSGDDLPVSERVIDLGSGVSCATGQGDDGGEQEKRRKQDQHRDHQRGDRRDPDEQANRAEGDPESGAPDDREEGEGQTGQACEQPEAGQRPTPEDAESEEDQNEDEGKSCKRLHERGRSVLTTHPEEG